MVSEHAFSNDSRTVSCFQRLRLGEWLERGAHAVASGGTGIVVLFGIRNQPKHDRMVP
jgi:hypothetical protein